MDINLCLIKNKKFLEKLEPTADLLINDMMDKKVIYFFSHEHHLEAHLAKWLLL